MLIACAQGAAVPAEPARNLEAVRGLAAEAAGRGAAVLVLPELYLSGYLPPDEIRGFAVALDGPEIAHAAESARRSRVALCLGFAERAPDGRLFDSAAFFDADGRVVSVYRKAHLFGGEASWAST